MPKSEWGVKISGRYVISEYVAAYILQCSGNDENRRVVTTADGETQVMAWRELEHTSPSLNSCICMTAKDGDL